MNHTVPARVSPPLVRSMTTAELINLVQRGDLHRGKAVFELGDRSRTDPAAAIGLGRLTRLPLLRDDRLFHQVSLAWAAIVALLAAESPHAKQAAYEAFADLDESDQQNLLDYLHCERIEDARPEDLGHTL